MTLPNWINIIFLALGVVGSLFFGFTACDVFEVAGAKTKHWAWKLHQGWFNFAGSAVGWFLAWFFARRLFQYLSAPCLPHLGWADAALIAAAFVGVTGYLPYATIQIVSTLRSLVEKAVLLLNK